MQNTSLSTFINVLGSIKQCFSVVWCMCVRNCRPSLRRECTKNGCDVLVNPVIADWLFFFQSEFRGNMDKDFYGFD